MKILCKECNEYMILLKDEIKITEEIREYYCRKCNKEVMIRFSINEVMRGL